MSQTHLKTCLLSVSLLSTAFGGVGDVIDFPEEAPTGVDLPTGSPDVFEYLKISGDIRTRYEFRDAGALDSSNALTTRARLGLAIGEFNGFSGFAEVEATAAIVDDFTVAQPSITPFNPSQTPIADPRNVELNRAWVQYKDNGILAKIGRQRIIRNDAFHIGNVGWRQNEQTFDAAQIGYSTDNFSISYVYSDRAQRIFGNDATGAVEAFEGDFHFIDASIETAIGQVGAYAYLIDVENQAAVGESNTFGAFTNLGPVYLEAAFQDGTSSIDGDYDSFLVRSHYTLKTDAGAFTAGIDYTEGGFKTPFQTAHAFFGFADAFLAQQIGLNNNSGFDGIFDGYLKYVKTGLPGGITFKGWLHYFANDGLDNSYGYEADMVLVKKFNEHFTGLIKAAYFLADDSSEFSDIKQVTFDISYKL